MARWCVWFWTSLWRRKVVTEAESNVQSKLERRLTTLEVAALGFATTFGLGVFITAKEAANHAGPASFVSVLVAGIAAVFPALCCAELTARLPLCGSGYISSFVMCGELTAFISGWSAMMGHFAGAAFFAKQCSMRIDNFLAHNVSNLMNQVAPLDAQGFAKSFDPLALGVTLLVMVGLILKTKYVSVVNCAFVMINAMVVTVLFILAATNFDPTRWTGPKIENSTAFFDPDEFAPKGVAGILRGAHVSFSAFLAFDVIATSVEETRTPTKSMPRGAFMYLACSGLFLAVLTCGFTLTSCFLSSENCASLSEALNFPALPIVINAAALTCFLSCLFGTLFALTRVIFAMARDHLIFRCLAWSSGRIRTPTAAAIFAGLLVGSASSLADMTRLHALDLMSVGLLVAFSLAPFSLILLRGSYDFQKRRKVELPPAELDTTPTPGDSVENLMAPPAPMYTCCKMLTCRSFCYHLFVRHSKTPTPISQLVTQVIAGVLFILIFALAEVTSFLRSKETSFVVSASVLAGLCLILTIILQIQPQLEDDKMFRVPLVPWFSVISIFITDCLMLQFKREAWIRFGVWMAIGLPLYLLYGIANSNVPSPQDTHRAQKVSSWILESRKTGHLGEFSMATEQTDSGLEESVTRF